MRKSEQIRLKKLKERTIIVYPLNKKCALCCKTKLSSQFNKNSTRLDGLCSYCKKCKNNRDRASRQTQDLKKHLESLFLPSMSWENRHLWHIDHIIPVTAYKYDSFNHPEFKKCWSLQNLRPIWAKDNESKKNKIFHELIAQQPKEIWPERLNINYFRNLNRCMMTGPFFNFFSIISFVY